MKSLNKRPFVDLFSYVDWNKRERFCNTAYGEGYGVVAVLPNSKICTVTPEDLQIWKCHDKNETSHLIPIPMAVLGDEPLMSEIRLMFDSGSVPIFYGGPLLGGNPLVLRNTLSYCSDMGVRIAIIPNEPSLNDGGMVNEGKASSMSGMKGIPAVGETIGAIRAMNFALEFETPLHLHDVTTARTLDEIREYRKKGLDVTCSVTMAHLCYSEEDLIESYWDPAFKVEVPLRSEGDRMKLWKAIEDGTIDAVTTGHLPLSDEDKKAPFEKAPFGRASMEGGLKKLLLVWRDEMKDYVSLVSLVKCLSSGPSRLLSIDERCTIGEAESYARDLLKGEK